VLISLAAVVVLSLQEPGRLAADTKLDLVVDPVGLLTRSLHLWDPSAGFGQLQGQVQGYLFPVGPFFVLGDSLGLPMWWVQRAWMGLILAVACAGTIRLAEELGIGRRATRIVGGLAYALAPTLIILIGPLSVLALVAALAPWSVVPLVRGARAGSPMRAAARSGVAISLMGGINVGATLGVLALPALWLATRQAGPRRRALVRWWLVAVALACAWWAVPLIVQAGYVSDYLEFIERAATTTAAASATESLRGTANWLAYFIVQGKPWWQGGWLLVAAPGAILATAGLAAAGLAGLAHRRLSERRFLLLALLVGMVVTAAGYQGPLGGPFAGVAHDLLDGPLVALRSINKCQPLITLPLALGLAHGLSVLRWRSLERPLVVGLVGVVLVGAALPLLRSQVLVEGTFERLPDHWSETADWLDANAGQARSLLLPASGFPDYTWGRPTDEPLQPLARSPWAVRNQAPLGSPGSTRLLDAVEERLVSGRVSPGLAPTLARAGVGYLVVRNDLDWRRANAPSPGQVRLVLAASPGIQRVATFGPSLRPEDEGDNNTASLSLRSVEIYRVAGDGAPVTTYAAEHATVLSGGPEGLLLLADRGRLEGPVVLAGDAAPPESTALRWAVTDSLRRRHVDVGLVHGASSYTLAADERPPGGGEVQDRLPVEGVSHQTVAVTEGAVSVHASSYATALAPRPESQPMAAFDGNPDTSWRSGSVGSSVGQWVEVVLDTPRDLSQLGVRLLDPGPGAPQVTRLRVTTEQGSREVAVDDTEEVQVLPVAPGPTSLVRVTLAGVVGEDRPESLARAGLREIELPGLDLRRLLAVPDDAVERFSEPDAPLPLFAFDRAVVGPQQPLRGDEEDRLARRFHVPRAGRFELTGTVTATLDARPDDLAPDASEASEASVGERAPGPGGCGDGPTVQLDGRAVPTELDGEPAEPRPGRQVAFSACAPLSLPAGVHDLVTEAGAALVVDSVTLVGAGWDADGPRPARPVEIRSWESGQRRVEVGPGPASFLTLAESYNAGWSASFEGERLQPVRLDGWRQAWMVPEGSAGVVELVFSPERNYRLALAAGFVGLAALWLLAGRTPRRSSTLPALMMMRHTRIITGAVAAALFAVGGPLALAGAAVVAVLPWRRAPSAVAGTALAAAGALAALEPASLPGSGTGTFGGPAQLLALVGLGAAGAAAIGARPQWWSRWWVRLGAGPGQQDGGHSGPTGAEAIEPAGEPGDVVEGGPGQGHVDESVGGQDLDQGPGSKEAQVTNDLPAGSSEHTEAADLGEHGLDAGQQQEAVEPSGQVGGGQQQGAAGDEHPADLGQGQVRVDQMLDDLAEEHDVEGAGPQGQAAVVDAGLHDGDSPARRGTDPVVGPVQAHDGDGARTGGDPGGHGAVAASEVEDPQ
jgi:arabinofuranan 3-O-arabinosyltransferase